MLFALDIGDRYLRVLRLTGHSDGPWTTQQARNLVMDLGEHVGGFRLLVRNRAGQFAIRRRPILGGLINHYEPAAETTDQKPC